MTEGVIAAVASGDREIARQPPVGGIVVRLVLQLALVALGLWVLVRALAAGYGAAVAILGILVVLLSVVLAFRNIHRLMIDASITADAEGVHFRIPRVPFRFCPYYRVEAISMPWSRLRGTSFLPAAQSSLLVEDEGGSLDVPPGQFSVPLPEIESRIREAAVGAGLELPGFQPTTLFESTKTPVLWVVGAVILAGGFALALGLDSQGARSGGMLPALLVLPGFGVIALALTGRRRVRFDSRGIFHERSKHLAFVPWDDIDAAHLKIKNDFLALWQSLRIRGVGDSSGVSVTLSRIFGLGLPLDEIESSAQRIVAKRARMRPRE